THTHTHTHTPHTPHTAPRSEEHTSELQSHLNLVCRLLLEKKQTHISTPATHQSRIPATSCQSNRLMSHRHTLCLIALCTQRLTRVPTPILISFFFNDTATTEIYTFSLHDALPI